MGGAPVPYCPPLHLLFSLLRRSPEPTSCVYWLRFPLRFTLQEPLEWLDPYRAIFKIVKILKSVIKVAYFRINLMLSMKVPMIVLIMIIIIEYNTRE